MSTGKPEEPELFLTSLVFNLKGRKDDAPMADLVGGAGVVSLQLGTS